MTDHKPSLQLLDETHPLIIVDDNEEDLFIAERIFKKSNLRNELLTLSSGYALMEYLEQVKIDADKMPALILLDINMPGMKGLEALESIRNNSIFKNLPRIIIFSHSANEDDRSRAMALGADGYKVKPQDIADYIHFFNSLNPQNGDHGSKTLV